jgi:hypothetical protein
MPSRRSKRNSQQQAQRHSQRHSRQNRRLHGQRSASGGGVVRDNLPDGVSFTQIRQQAWPESEAHPRSGTVQSHDQRNDQHQQQQQQPPCHNPTMTPQEARQIAANQVYAVYQQDMEIHQYMAYLQQSTERLRQQMWEAQQREMIRNRQWLMPPAWAIRTELPEGT